MSLLIGHTCPGCGLDTPEVKCESCERALIWDAYQGAHCLDCSKAFASLVCEECGRESDL